MKRRDLPLLGLIVPLIASSGVAQAPKAAPPATASSSNPFLTASSLPFQAPPFDKIQDSDYTPAMEEGMKRQIMEIEAIAANPEAPTFANTIEAMERSGEVLTRAGKVFFNLAQSNTNEALQKIRAEEAPKLAAHQTTIYLNGKLFARVKSLYDRRKALQLDPQGLYLVERTYRNFVRSGAQLGETDKTKLRAWNEEEAKLQVEFADKLLAERNSSAVVVDNVEELKGLS
jgi:peptidyl-dipeptidase Dcp